MTKNASFTSRAGMPTAPNDISALQRLVFAALCAMGGTLAALDFKGLRSVAHALGATLWYTLPARRAMAIYNIRRSLDVPEAEAKDIARESFNHNAQSFLEAVLVPRFGFDHPLLHIATPDQLAAMRSCEQPVIISTGHMGAWELLAGLLGEYLPADRPRLVITRRYRNPAVNAFLCGLRSSRGAQVVGHRKAVFSVLKALKSKGVAGFLVDHNTNHAEALFLPFLGRQAAVNMGPALLALRAGARVCPVYLLRQDSTYNLHCLPDLDAEPLASLDRDQAIRHIATFYTNAAEQMIRRAPEQWFWMHNRWKTQPDDAS